MPPINGNGAAAPGARRVRVATFNVSTLSGRLDLLLKTIEENDIDACFVQETRFSFDALRAKRELARTWGYKLRANVRKGQSAMAGGLAMFVREGVDADAINGPKHGTYGRRTMYARFGRADGRPIRFCNVHGWIPKRRKQP